MAIYLVETFYRSGSVSRNILIKALDEDVERICAHVMQERPAIRGINIEKAESLDGFEPLVTLVRPDEERSIDDATKNG